MKGRQAAPGVTRLALATIIAHALIVSVHGAAHQILGVQASPSQTLFIFIVIMLAPLLAGLLLWKRYDNLGAILLACSMAGSLAFGVYNHFVAISPDHVSIVSRMSLATWALIFQGTALLLAAIEAVGVYAGISLLKKKIPTR